MDILQNAFKDSVLLNDDYGLLKLISYKKELAEDLIRIYKNNYYSNLTNALSTTFPTVQKLIGDECFESLSYHYIKKNPSNKGSLLNYGHKFSSYIAQLGALKEIPYLEDVAKLDYLIERVHYTKNEQDIDISNKNALMSKNFKLKCCVEIIKSKYPIDFIHRFCNAKCYQKNEIQLPKSGVKLVVFKHHYKTKFIKLLNYEYQFILHLKKLGNLNGMSDYYQENESKKVQKFLLKMLRFKLLTYL
jgi:hypothetical protein